MTNELPDPLEQMQKDWQQTETPPLSVDAIRRRLRWRWLHFGLDGLGLLVVTGILVWSTSWISGVLEWVYWSFFLVAFVLTTAATVYWRLRALRRPNDSITAVLEHARRDAWLRLQTGRLAIWLSATIAVFVAIWLVLAGWLDPMPLGEYLGQRLSALVFALVWCGLAIAFGAWLRETGLRQHLELDQLERELRD